MNTRIVADARHNTLGADSISAEPASWEAWIERALDDGIVAAVVLGDDATLAAFATAQAEVGRRRSEPLWVAPLAAGELKTVCDEVAAADATSRALKKLVKRIERGDARRTQVDTLRIVDSVKPSAILGFSFGMGAFTRLFGPSDRVRRRDALRDALGGTETVNADVRLDWDHATSSFGYLLASSLSTSWAQVKMGASPSIRLGSSPMELLRGATKVGRALERAAGGTAKPFGCVHIDTNSDYVVDGRLVSVDVPRLIALSAGPKLRILV